MVALEEYTQHMVSYTLGLALPPPQFLLEKLQLAEERHRSSEAQIFAQQHRILDLELRLEQTKEEASMNAIALKRNIALKENLEAELKRITMEKESLELMQKQTSEHCMWLENECSLYLKDREVFMGVAEDAEEKAFQAEEKLLKAERRCSEAEKGVAQLFAKTQEFERIQMENNDEIMRLGCQIEQLQKQTSNLQEELEKAEKRLADAEALQDRSLQTSRLPIEECMCRQWQGPQELMAEIQRLWKEISGYKIELAKAELLKARNMVTSSPPAAKKGRFTMSKLPSNGGLHNDARQPLGSLPSNVIHVQRERERGREIR